MIVCLAFVAWKTTTDKTAARARNVQGLYIFTDCQPVGEYEVLGTVTFAGTMRMGSTQYEAIRDKLIKRAKEDYPMGEGLVLDLRSGGTDKADVIKFK